MQDASGRSGRYFVRSRKKNSRFLLDTYRLFENIRDQLLEGAKELEVAGPFRVAGPDPRSVDQTGKQMPIEQRLHILLKLLAQLTPIALVLGVDEQRRNEIDVLDVQLTGVTGEQIAAAVFEWQLGPDQTILAVAGPLPPLEAALEISSRVLDDEALSSSVALIFAHGCFEIPTTVAPERVRSEVCLLYTSDAADE